MKLIKPSFTILNHLEYPMMLRLVCRACCSCYRREIPSVWKEQEQEIHARIKAGHESVIEHVGFSVQLTVDRGLTHELVRHRLASFTQESSRYCNYSKDKFDGQLTYIMPAEMSAIIPEGQYNGLEANGQTGSIVLKSADPGKDVFIDQGAIVNMLGALLDCESAYLLAIEQGMAPEIARAILPNATAASIVISANMREWRHIFSLRALGKTGRPHPQMIEIMTPLLEAAILPFPVFFQDL